MSESLQPNETLSQVYIKALKKQFVALAIAIPVLYLPFLWLAFDFEFSPYSGVLILSPAYAISSLVRIPFLGPVICIAFLALAWCVVFICLYHSKLWLIPVCLVLAVISTASSYEIYEKTKNMIGNGLPSGAVQAAIFVNIFLKE